MMKSIICSASIIIIIVTNVYTQQLVVPQIGHSGEIMVVKFSPDGKYVASAGIEGVSKLWEISTGRIVYNFGSSAKSVGSRHGQRGQLKEGKVRKIEKKRPLVALSLRFQPSKYLVSRKFGA